MRRAKFSLVMLIAACLLAGCGGGTSSSGSSAASADLGANATLGTCWTDLTKAGDSLTGTEVDCAKKHTFEVLGTKKFLVVGDYDQDYVTTQSEIACQTSTAFYQADTFDLSDASIINTVPTKAQWDAAGDSGTVQSTCGAEFETARTGKLYDTKN